MNNFRPKEWWIPHIKWWVGQPNLSNIFLNLFWKILHYAVVIWSKCKFIPCSSGIREKRAREKLCTDWICRAIIKCVIFWKYQFTELFSCTLCFYFIKSTKASKTTNKYLLLFRVSVWSFFDFVCNCKDSTSCLKLVRKNHILHPHKLNEGEYIVYGQNPISWWFIIKCFSDWYFFLCFRDCKRFHFPFICPFWIYWIDVYYLQLKQVHCSNGTPVLRLISQTTQK